MFKKRGVDYQLAEGISTLPAKYYTSDSAYQKDLEKIFYQKWFLAGRGEEMANPGDYLTLDIGRENIIVIRDKNHQLRAFFNVCRHRGTRMINQEAGHCQGSIKCPYHAWSYDFNGNLLGAPLMNELKSFQKLDYPLFAVGLAEWGGFIFLNLKENPPPFAGEMGKLQGRFSDWQLEKLVTFATLQYELNCNWKLIIHNYQECYHCPGVHPCLADLTPFRSAEHDCFSGNIIGGFMTINRPGGSLTTDGNAAGPYIGRVSGADRQRVYYYSVWPNMLLTVHPDFVMYHKIIPRGPDKITNYCYFLAEPKTVADPQKLARLQTAVSFWDQTNREDWQVCEQMQLGLQSSRFDRGIYSGQEDILAAIDQEYLKVINS